MEDQTNQTQPSPEVNVPVAPAVEEQAETNAPRMLKVGDTVRIRGGGVGYISQISVRVAEPLPDDPDERVCKRWVPASDVEAV